MWFLLNRFGIVLNFVVLEVDVRWVIGILLSEQNNQTLR